MNRHAIKWAILGATLIALMGPTGGYPSRPTFQNVNIERSTTGSMVQIGSISYPWIGSFHAIDLGLGGGIVNDNTAGISLWSNLYYDGVDKRYKTNPSPAAGGARLVVGQGTIELAVSPFTGTAGGIATETVAVAVANDANVSINKTLVVGGGMIVGTPTGGNTGTGTVNAAALYQNGIRIPRTVAVQCSNIGATAVGGFGGICSRSAVGAFSVTFSIPFANVPWCVGTVVNSTATFVSASGALASAQFFLWNQAGAAADNYFNAICVGI